MSMVEEGYKSRQRKFSDYQKRMRDNPTPAEQAVKQALDKLKVEYTFQKGFLRDKTTRLVDFYIMNSRFGHRICLEIDGKYHEGQRQYDAYRESRIMAQRKTPTRFVRLTNEWVLSRPNLAKALEKALA